MELRAGFLPRSLSKSALLTDGPFGRGYYSAIYAIHAIGCSVYKIGRTASVERRFQTLQTSSPVPLELCGYVWLPTEAEQSIHKHLAEHRSHGEWFRKSDQVTEMVTLIQSRSARAICDLVGHQKTEIEWYVRRGMLPEEELEAEETV